MNAALRRGSLTAAIALVAAFGGFATAAVAQGTVKQDVVLSGSNEVPPVTTTASGKGTVTVNADRSVAVSVTVTGMTPTAAHIHEGAAGANGPVVVPFTKKGEDTFVAADDAKLTESQYASFKAGNLYINVHSAKNPGGEVRAQLKGN
jgi:hypothetical protein